MKPRLINEWQIGEGSVEAGNLHNFTYYVVCNMPLHQEGGQYKMSTRPLLGLLARNNMGPTMKSPFKDLSNSNPDNYLLLTSSEFTAMTLGFYAFREACLTLIEVRAKGLINGSAPWMHPLGAFWPLSLSEFTKQVHEGDVRFRYAAFEMTLSQTAPAVPGWKVCNSVRAERLLSKKRKLEEAVHTQESEMGKLQKELQAVKKELKILAPLPGPADTE